jgi:hypothetical protein
MPVQVISLLPIPELEEPVGAPIPQGLWRFLVTKCQERSLHLSINQKRLADDVDDGCLGLLLLLLLLLTYSF